MKFSGSYSKRDDVERNYRISVTPELIKARVVIGESDLMLLSNVEIKDTVAKELKLLRRQLKEYINVHPDFATSLEPYPEDPVAPNLIKWMITATDRAGVGPMAAVAGAIAGSLGQKLDPAISEVIIENGGDIYLRSDNTRTIAVYAGKSPLSKQIGILLPAQPSGFSVCTSAGTVGPSLSFGRADAAVILSTDAALADAVATAAGNLVKTVADLANAVAFVRTIKGISGCLIIKDDKLAVWGELELVPLQ